MAADREWWPCRQAVGRRRHLRRAHRSWIACRRTPPAWCPSATGTGNDIPVHRGAVEPADRRRDVRANRLAIHPVSAPRRSVPRSFSGQRVPHPPQRRDGKTVVFVALLTVLEPAGETLRPLDALAAAVHGWKRSWSYAEGMSAMVAAPGRSGSRTCGSSVPPWPSRSGPTGDTPSPGSPRAKQGRGGPPYGDLRRRPAKRGHRCQHDGDDGRPCHDGGGQGALANPRSGTTRSSRWQRATSWSTT
jgi:hypothetical protein